jgi:hypothetical protein
MLLQSMERSRVHLLWKHGPASEKHEWYSATLLKKCGYICSWTATKMDPPQFLLDALTDSVSSGTFVDTKFFVFSRRETTRCVGSPRALYCNSRVLDAVPHFFTRE